MSRNPNNEMKYVESNILSNGLIFIVKISVAGRLQKRRTFQTLQGAINYREEMRQKRKDRILEVGTRHRITKRKGSDLPSGFSEYGSTLLVQVSVNGLRKNFGRSYGTIRTRQEAIDELIVLRLQFLKKVL